MSRVKKKKIISTGTADRRLHPAPAGLQSAADQLALSKLGHLLVCSRPWAGAVGRQECCTVSVCTYMHPCQKFTSASSSIERQAMQTIPILHSYSHLDKQCVCGSLTADYCKIIGFSCQTTKPPSTRCRVSVLNEQAVPFVLVPQCKESCRRSSQTRDPLTSQTLPHHRDHHHSHSHSRYRYCCCYHSQHRTRVD